ncbi:Putative glycosyl hydrolase [Durusdinium trenchii]|uniref:Glycosyl hydrolase n=1 Tax=Durusdinium trenchii TaxID=1381693 RepID=A0ABP0S4R2_9DINO
MTSGFAAFARSEWNDHVSYAVQHGEAVYQRFKTTRRSLGYATSDPVIPSKGMMARRMSGAEAHLLGSKEFAILQLDVDMQRLFERGLLEFKPGCKFCCLLDRNILREATLSFSTISVKISEEGDAAAEACPLAGKWVFFSPQNAHELVKSLPDEPHCYFSDLHLCVYAAWLAGGNKGSDIKIEREAQGNLPACIDPSDVFLHADDDIQGEVEDRCVPGQWLPGSNVGSWISPFAPISQQALVLIGNAWTNVFRVPKRILKACQSYLPNIKGMNRCSLQVAFVSQLLAVSPHSVRAWIEGLKQNEWVPVQKQSLSDWWQRKNKTSLHDGDAPASKPQSEVDSESVLLERVVQRALYCCFENRTGLEYERDMASLADLCPGMFGTTCRGREFYTNVIHLAATSMRHLDGLDLSLALPGLGICSDVSLMLDPVSLGTGTFARHGTTLVLCVASISAHTHRIQSIFLDAPTMSTQGHTGDSVRDLALETMKNHPASLSMAALKGGARKVGHLSKVPGNIVRNLPAYILGLHGRIVAFLLVFQSAFESCVRPYVLASQKAVEPWVLRKAEMRMLQNIDRMVASIQEASKFLAILALLRPHLSRAEVARFIVARSSQSSARLIFDFWLSLPGLVTKSPPMLGKCALQQQDLPLEQGSICLSPHCQCASKLAHLNNAAKPEELPLISVVRASRKRKRHREIPVPVWVAYGAAIASTSQDTATEAQTPRFQVCPTPKPTGIPDMFRRKGCQVPITVYQQHADIQASLTSSLGFLKNLQENIKAALGDAGVNEHMQRLLSDACEAWDWDFLLRNKPLNRHVDAFMRLVDSLKCTLDHSAWPDEKQARVSCIFGSPRDRLLVKIVCQILEKAKIRVSSNQRALPVQQIQAMRVAAQEAGRCYDGLFGHASMEDILEVAIPDEWVGSSCLKTRDIRESRRRSLHDSLPVDLPSTISEALKPYVGKEILEPPPMTVRLSKQKMRNSAPSSKKAALAEWLESSEGQLWRKERDTIFAG